MPALVLVPLLLAVAVGVAWFAATGLVVAVLTWPLLAAVGVGCICAAVLSTNKRKQAR